MSEAKATCGMEMQTAQSLGFGKIACRFRSTHANDGIQYHGYHGV
jgi:hypothetical protein